MGAWRGQKKGNHKGHKEGLTTKAQRAQRGDNHKGTKGAKDTKRGQGTKRMGGSMSKFKVQGSGLKVQGSKRARRLTKQFIDDFGV